MWSLAPILYARVHARYGGPVARLVRERYPRGNGLVQAQAYLRSDLIHCSPSVIFSQSDGTGTHRHSFQAVAMAISEALERWAHGALSKRPDRDLFGFDCDPSTTGMAAFPGLIARQARPFARQEAWERYLLLSWWEGCLTAQPCRPWNGVMGSWAIQAPNVPYILGLHCQREDNGLYTYGFGAGRRLEQVWRRADIERERAAACLDRFHRERGPLSFRHVDEIAHPFEKRVVYFALPEGHALFLDRIRRPAFQTWTIPNVVCDREITGPWSRYARVWRCLFDPRRFASAFAPIPFYFYW